MKCIGKYEVLDEIGSSASGTTYRVRDTFRKRELALKVLQPLPTLEPAAKDEFYRQLSLCADLTHRHLAKIVDLGEVESRIYIASELISGFDLRGIIAGNREVTIAQKIGILAQVCEGLAFAHSREIAHGGIKPGNIFVDANNDVAILDLGTAKWQSLLLTASAPPDGVLPNYFAPEQILGQRFDSKSDLFSLAVVAYELIAGRYPFEGPVSLIPREIVHSDPEPLRKLMPGIPEELEQLLIRGLKKKPEERLQTAEEFAAGLYGIAQQLRRTPSSTVAPAVAPPASESRDTPPVPRETVVAAPAPADTPARPKMPEPEVKTPRRQDVQARADEQPWTARSYSANPLNRSEEKAGPQWSRVPETSIPPAPPPPRSASIVPPPYSRATAEVPAFNPPARIASGPAGPSRNLNRIPRKPASAKPLSRRLIAVALGAVLAIYLVVNYVSRQGLRASQNHAVSSNSSAPEKLAAPETKRNTERLPLPVEPAPAVAPDPVSDPEPAAPEHKAQPKIEKVFRKEIKTVWESGDYSEAMRLVDRTLSADPSNSEARSWKKKIRAAQDAEAALK